MTIWTPALDNRSGPRYLAIVEALAEDVANGRVAAGTRLPTHRDLAWQLGLTVGTVSRAYAEAARRGLISGEVGRGTFVLGDGPGEPDAPRFGVAVEGGPTRVDISLNCPFSPDRSALAEALNGMARSPDLEMLMDFNPGAGLRRHREAGARLIGRLGWTPDPAHVMVTNGGQHALTIAFAALCRPGETALTETLTYPGTRSIAELLGLRLKGIEMDDQGMLPDALDEACRQHKPKVLFCQPTIHNPTTATMGAARRDAIADIALRHGLTVIEDDLYGYHVSPPLAPLCARIPEHCVFITSATKCMVSALRTGFAVAPERLVERMTDVLRTTAWMAAPLDAEVIATWIDNGTADRMIAQRRGHSLARRDLISSIMSDFDVRMPEGAFHAWLRLPEGWTVASAVAAARARDIHCAPTDAFVASRGQAIPPFLRLSLIHEEAEARLADGLTNLARMLRHPPAAKLSVV